RQPSAYEELQTFSAVLNHIRVNYIDSVTYTQLVRAAIDGVMQALDPHSRFESHADRDKAGKLDRGELAVTGLVLEDVDGAPSVLTVMSKSPADKAGIQPGDRLALVNDTTVAGLDVRALELRLAGDKGSKVRLCFERGPRLEPDTFSVTLKRAGEFSTAPLIVLIDGGSASAAEALAASLQDHDRALLLGRRSFGKALMQTAFLTPSGDIVWLTVGRVITPSGRFIQRRYRGLRSEEYRAFGGVAGAGEDTLETFRTDNGRTVRGGGGIAPDVELPRPAPVPVWWSAAADSGLDDALADSIALTLPAT